MRWINLDCVAGCAAVVRSHRLCRGSASSTVLVCRTVRLSGRLSVHCSAANDKEPINPAEALTKSLSGMLLIREFACLSGACDILFTT